MADVYDFALVDWHYRHGEESNYVEPDDNLNWQDVADFILEREKNLPESQRFMVDTARAMKEGRYAGDSRLAPRVAKGKAKQNE